MMKAKNKNPRKGDMLAGYDFSAGVRAKYASRNAKGTNLVLLAPDVAEVFPDADAANRALRACGELINALPPVRKKCRG